MTAGFDNSGRLAGFSDRNYRPPAQEQHRPRRRNLLAETRLTSEWVAINYPGRSWHFQFRVGNHPESAGVIIEDEAERRWAENYNRRVDAVIEPPPTLVLIEAKMWDATAAIGRIMEYEFLMPATREVASWPRAPIETVLLTAQHDPIAEILCRQNGIRYVFWVPPWIDDWYAAYPERRRKAAHHGLTDDMLRSFNGPSATPLT